MNTVMELKMYGCKNTEETLNKLTNSYDFSTLVYDFFCFTLKQMCSVHIAQVSLQHPRTTKGT